MPTKLISIFLFFTCSLHSTIAIGEDKASFKQCSKIVKQIKLYEKKRRAGGKVKQMNRWKKKRAEYQLEFYKKRCNEYRNLNTSLT